MKRVVFLLEEYSMKVLLEGLLPRLFPDLPFLCLRHDGKQDLERSIPRKLKAWREPGVRFVVMRDNDGSNCLTLKQHLVEITRRSGRADTIVRIVCQELEAWYFGAPDALADAFDRPKLRALAGRASFRDPDAIAQPARALAERVEEFQKVSGARRMAQALTRENRSRSFQVLIAGIDGLAAEIQRGNIPPGAN